MLHHSQLCKPALAGINDDNNQEEECDIEGNGEDNNDFVSG